MGKEESGQTWEGNDVTIELDQSTKQKIYTFLGGRTKQRDCRVLNCSFLIYISIYACLLKIVFVRQWFERVIITAHKLHALMKWISRDLDKHNFKMQIIYLPNWATHLKLEFDPFHPSLKIKVIL